MSVSVKRVLPRLRRLLEAAERGDEMDAIRCLDLIERKARHELDHNMAPDDSSARWELGLHRRAKSRAFQREQDAHDLLDWFMKAGLVEPFGNGAPSSRNGRVTDHAPMKPLWDINHLGMWPDAPDDAPEPTEKFKQIVRDYGPFLKGD